MKKVLVFGTFDVFHPGHDFFLREAKRYGDLLYVVVARDKTVKLVKGKLPRFNENERLRILNSLIYVEKAVLGYEGDKYHIIEEIKPDIICLGYDQVHFIDRLEENLRKRRMTLRIIRIEKSYKPEIYKSSKITELQLDPSMF